MAEEIQSLVAAKEVGHTVVDVKGLVNSMKEKLDSISESTPPPFQICRVPATIRNKDNYVYYDPKIVSIGPFHRGNENLQAMEEHKWRYLRNVLRAMEKHKRRYLHNVLDHCTIEPALEECVKKYLKEEIAEKARKCYSGNMGLKHDDEFVKMMLLDGAFIIQLLLLRKDIEQNDPIRRTIWMVHAIANDMLLLENQLPFCVLECLAECIGTDANALKKAALEFFSKSLSGTLNFKQSAKNETPVPSECETLLPSEDETHDIHHLLHLVHCSLKLASPTTEEPQRKVSTIPTATELEEAGVGFKRNEGGSYLDVTFKNGVMQLPRLKITDDTNTLFRNIIAFEQCFPGNGGDFTSYCFFMDSLVNTPRDVQILKQSDIIENMLGSDEEVALFFNQLCKEIAGDFGKGSVGKACEDVHDYSRRCWPKSQARLKHDYFSNPWAVISFIAAAYALFLASVSTYYAVF